MPPLDEAGKESTLGGAAVIPNAFQAVYRDHFPFVWRSMRGLGVEPSGLDDAVQEVFLVVLRRLGGFEGRSSLKTWLFGIAIHVARRHVSRRSKNAHVELDHELRDHLTPSPLEAATRANAAEILGELLRSLDEKHRAVFHLAEVEEMSAPEIAEALGIKLNTVYSRLRKARSDFDKSLARRRAQEMRSER